MTTKEIFKTVISFLQLSIALYKSYVDPTPENISRAIIAVVTFISDVFALYKARQKGTKSNISSVSIRESQLLP
ncbi:MAG: hypothetical protein AAF614_12330 [Chloroflexota bacterium]